ncbi:serine hydrolase domain-containing protein [Lactiplantibacillus daowaiensis]|uniref:Serine hydrolase domain-containing protein n=1 Tax=Lactiplantibacillus daowaiensis TaxID=2559918 RepID=A0ABW1RZH7_9LACO|nr:serine hydrolase domain-containing protein [Lactiplantibacillus daowaiensis]
MHYRRTKRYYHLRLFLIILVSVGALTLLGKALWPAAKPATKSKSTITVTKTAHAKAKPAKPKPLTIVVKNQAIDHYLTKLHFTGTALIVRENQVVLRKAYGLRNRKADLKNQLNTPYYIGSTEKALIATAILQLQSAGKLSVKDPVKRYFPKFPNGQAITLKHLLTHTSGLAGHQEADAKVTPAELVKDIEKQGITSQPGSWHYLDSNYTVLAYLVEKLSGQPLMTYFQTHIFKPAQMNDVLTYQAFAKSKQRSTGYRVTNGKYVTPALPDLSQLYGVGNLAMSVTDMYRFDAALMRGDLINAKARKQMLTAGSTSGYGMGFYVDPGAYNSHGIVSGWNVSNSFTHTGKTYIVLMSNVQNNIRSFGQVNDHLYQLLNQAD